MRTPPEEQVLVDKLEELVRQRDELDRRIEGLRIGLAALRGEEVALRPARRGAPRTRRVLDLLAEAGDRGMTRGELSDALGEENPDLLSNGLTHLKRGGHIRRAEGGRWVLVATM
jgi:hypothetical protein